LSIAKERKRSSLNSTSLDLEAAIAELDDQYRRRADGFEFGRSLSLLAGDASAADCYEIKWRLSRAMFLLGEKAAGYLIAGIDCGAKAVKLQPGRVEGNFWLGVNEALHAEHSPKLKAVFLVGKARTHLKRAVSISEHYHGAGPLRVLGRLYQKAPWFVGGDVTRARQYYERALSLAPTNSVTLLYAAELAIQTGELTRAAELLGRIVDTPVDPDWELENLRDKKLACSLLAKIK